MQSKFLGVIVLLQYITGETLKNIRCRVCRIKKGPFYSFTRIKGCSLYNISKQKAYEDSLSAC